MAIGDWVGLYGSLGYWLPGETIVGGGFTSGTSADDVGSGLGAGVTSDAPLRSVWASPSSDGRALQTPDAASRVATICWKDDPSDGANFHVSLPFFEDFTGIVSVYAVGWDRSRPMAFDLGGDVKETGENTDGVWVRFDVSVTAGTTLTLTVTSHGSYQPLINGIFFDPLGVVSPSGIASAEAFGDPAIVLALQVIEPSGVASAEAFGDPAMATSQEIDPSGIASDGEEFGRPRVLKVGQQLYPSGILSAEAFGDATVGSPPAQYLTVRAIVRTAAFGIPSLLDGGDSLIEPPGCAPSGAVGTPLLLMRGPGAGAGAVPRNVLVDRKSGEVYPWPMNHSSEDSIKTLGRRLTRSGVTPSGRLISQPTHPGPVHLVLLGHFLDRDQQQYATFVRFFRAADRTFDYIDAAGDSYHIAITSFDARRKLGPSRIDGSYFDYTLEVEVISASGPYRKIAV